MARHAAPKSRNSTATRALLRAGLTLGAAGAALAGGAVAASAAPQAAGADAGTAGSHMSALDVPSALGAVSNLKLNPLAGTGVDPTDNGVGTRVADFQPVSTKTVTAPLSDGDALSDLPVAGPVVGHLTHG